MVIEYPEATQVIVCGDIHGNFKGLVHRLCVQYGCRDTLLVVAGDCGFGFEKPGYYATIYNQVAGRLKKSNNWVVFVRGNHDDPSYFSEGKIAYKRWRTVPDYSVIQACGHNILCVGGAVSIDRKERKEENGRMAQLGHTETAVWWADEAPDFKVAALDAIPEGIEVDAVVTHTAPSFCPLLSIQNVKTWIVADPGLEEDLKAERDAMDRLFEALKEKGHPVWLWYYGHFHQSWSGNVKGTDFTILDIEEFKEIPSN